MGKRINIKVDGMTYDLDSLFEAAEGISSDVEEAVDSVEKFLEQHFSEPTLTEITNELKKRVVSKHSDRYEYIPTDAEETIRESQVRYLNRMRKSLLVVIVGSLLIFGVVFLAAMLSPSTDKATEPVVISEKLEPL